MGGSISSSTCGCGNPGVVRCQDCTRAVCRLCVRKDERGRELCLQCRTGAIELAEERERRRSERTAAQSSARLKAVVKDQKRRPILLIIVGVVALIGVMSAIAMAFLADKR